MKHEVLQALYIHPLSLMKIWGRIDEPADNVEICVNGKHLGTANLNVYVHQERKEFWPNQRNYVLQKVMPLDTFPTMLRVEVYAGKKLVSIMEKAVDVTEETPEQFCSSIGTKNGITINDEKRTADLVQSVRDCDFKPPLKFLHIESSSACNLRCKYCVVGQNYQCIERSILSEEVLDRAIEIINQSPELKIVQISGLGEPLTNPNFCHILERIEKETKIRIVWFFTNGMLLTREVAKQISKSKLYLRIIISIDGATPEENDFYRKGSEYRVVRRNLMALLKNIRNRPWFDVQIHNLNIQGKEANILPPKFLLEDFGFLRIDSHRAFYFPELSEEKLRKAHISVYKNQHKHVCRRMFEQATIRSNGDVVRCHWDSTCSIVMGNVLKTPFEQIWHGENYRTLRKTMMPEVPFDQLPLACQKCHAMNDGYLYRQD